MDLRHARAFVEGTPPETGPIRFVAGTEGLKIDGRDFAMDGADLGRYQTNPVVLWGHNQTMPPIGRAVDTEVDGTRLLIDVEFDQADEFARIVERKYRDGFLNAVSMLPLPKGYTRGAPLGRGRIDEWELVEVSAVSVPLDPDAIKVGRSAMAHLGRELLDLAGRELSHNDIRERLYDLLSDRFGDDNTWVWVRDVGDDWVAFDVEGDGNQGTFRLGYSRDGDEVTLADGDPEPVVVKTTFETADQAADAAGADMSAEDADTVRRLEALGFVRSTPATTKDLNLALAHLADAFPSTKEN